MTQWIHSLWNSPEGLTKIFYAAQWATAIFGLFTVFAIVLSIIVSNRKDKLEKAEEARRAAIQMPRAINGQQSSELIAALSPYRGQKVVILAALGDEPLAFARNFLGVFETAGWEVYGPNPAPLDQNAVGLQISISTQYWGHPPPPAVKALFDTLRRMNLGCRDTYVVDPSVRPDTILFWVGTKTNLQVPPQN